MTEQWSENMGSRVMHYCISTMLSKELNIRDDQFLLGGLAPDVYNGELKERSHFMWQDVDGIAHVDYNSFRNKYLREIKTPFHLGYFFHLISDDIWLNEIYFKKVKWLAPDIKPEAKRQYYRDFWRLNGKLLDHYSLELVTLKLQPIEIDEINYAHLPELVTELENDFVMADSVKGESLEILGFNDVIRAIDKTVADCLNIYSQ